MEFKRGVHKFSGLNPDEFNSFMASMGAFENTLGKGVDVYVVAGHLYQAIEHASSLTSDAHVDHQEQMQELCTKLGIHGEFLIQESISGTPYAFRSRYLKSLA